MPVYTSSIEVTADYPTIKPSLNLNFARARALDPRITFTRASVGTYVGRDGLVKTAGNDEARFDHDPDTLESLGLLIEESRTNYATYSEDFTTSWATAAIGSVTANSTTSPDGNNNGTLLVNTSPSPITVDGQTTYYGGQIYKGTHGPDTGTYTWSLFAKAKECEIIAPIANTNGGSKQAFFDLSNGTVFFAPSDTTCVIEPYPNGWYKCSISWDQGSSVSYTYNIQIFSKTEITGSDGIYIWGAQLEKGAFPTSYIPTSGSTVTRAGERALIDQQIASGDITIVSEYKVRMTTSNQWNRLFGFGEGSSDIRPFINSNGNITWYNYGTDSPITDWSALGLSVPDNSYFRFAFAVRQNVANSVSVNGTTVSTQSNANPGAYVNWNELYLGWADIGNTPRDITGHIKYFRLYNDAFTDTQLQLLSK